MYEQQTKKQTSEINKRMDETGVFSYKCTEDSLYRVDVDFQK